LNELHGESSGSSVGGDPGVVTEEPLFHVNVFVNIDFNHVHGREVATLSAHFADVVRLPLVDASFLLGACARCNRGVATVDVEGQVQWHVAIRIHLPHCVLHNGPYSVSIYVMHSLDMDLRAAKSLNFPGVNVSNSYQGHIFLKQYWPFLSASDCRHKIKLRSLFCEEAQQMAQRHAVLVPGVR